MKIKIVDDAFAGQNYTNPTWIGLSKIEWERSSPTSDDEIVIYTDDCMHQNKVGKVKIAWLFESEEFKPNNYDYIRTHSDEFDYIFTWNKALMDLNNPKFILLPYGGSWINDNQEEMYPKSKMVSIVASSKNFLSGHAMRHDAIARYPGKFDVYGNGYNRIDSLITAFQDYRFTIVIENTKVDYGFSEKIVTPMLCGTIPIYYGTPSIGKFFNDQGFFQFDTVDELEGIIDSLSIAKYDQMYHAAHENFKIARMYRLMEDTVYRTLIELGIIKDDNE